jgi:glycosyltransferase involved in cell wall biosynthesis
MEDRWRNRETVANLAGFLLEVRNPILITVSVITPVDAASSPELLQSTIDSLTKQTCPEWQLCVVADGSASAEVRGVMREAASADRRVLVQHRDGGGGPAKSANRALDSAGGDFVAVVDPGDVLVKGTVAALQRTLAENPEMDYCYSDEVGLSSDGCFTKPSYKPDWSPERMRAQFYTGRLSALRRTLVSELGGFRSEFDGCYDRELSLRASENTDDIVHLAEVLYFRRIEGGVDTRVSDPDANESGRRAIEQHCDRVGIDAAVEQLPFGNYRVRRRLPSRPLVSIVIPTRGSAAVVQREPRVHVLHAVSSILERSTYTNVEFVIVPDRETPWTVVEQLEVLCGDRLRIKAWDGPFNFSAKVNVGVAASSGTVALLLNDDVEVLTPDWIETLVGFIDEPDCGVVGCKLLTAFDTLQHGGHVYDKGRMAHAYGNYRGDERGMGDLLVVDRECSGVTAACAALRREVYERVGGMCEALPVNYNDVDLCLKIRKLGLRVVWTPHAVLYHFESLTRGRKNEVSPFESDYVRNRWQDALEVDPYSNPHLDQSHADFVVARPPESWLL